MSTQWDSVTLPRFSKVSADGKFDVVIIGGGVTGLMTAYFLKRVGAKVCVLERGKLGHGDTGCTTAHLTGITDLRLKTLCSTFGKDEAALAWWGGMLAIQRLDELTRVEGFDFDLKRVPAFLHAAFGSPKDETRELEEEAKLASEIGFDAQFVAEVPVVQRPGIQFPGQGKCHPMKLLKELARRIDGEKCEIHEESPVEEILEKPMGVMVNGAQILCDAVVCATHVPLASPRLVNSMALQTKLAAYSSYVVSGTIPKGKVLEANFYDTSDPYYYLRIDAGEENDIAILGGEDHKTGQASDQQGRYAKLKGLLKRLIPEAEVVHQWSGQVIETNDGLPYIGEIAPKQFVATGYAGNGMTFSVLAAQMICDAIQGRKNPWQELFSVDRKKIYGGTWDYLRENLDYPFYILFDRFLQRRGRSAGEIAQERGKVLYQNGEYVACSRDENGKLKRVSAVCTHMGCLVHWNETERTWDCPCHGSRFRADGEVVQGPAERGLGAVKSLETV